MVSYCTACYALFLGYVYGMLFVDGLLEAGFGHLESTFTICPDRRSLLMIDKPHGTNQHQKGLSRKSNLRGHPISSSNVSYANWKLKSSFGPTNVSSFFFFFFCVFLRCTSNWLNCREALGFKAASRGLLRGVELELKFGLELRLELKWMCGCALFVYQFLYYKKGLGSNQQAQQKQQQQLSRSTATTS